MKTVRHFSPGPRAVPPGSLEMQACAAREAEREQHDAGEGGTPSPFSFSHHWWPITKSLDPQENQDPNY